MACKHSNYYGTTVGFVCRDCGVILPERPTAAPADPEPVKTETPAEPEPAPIKKTAPKKAPAKKTTTRGRAKK